MTERVAQFVLEGEEHARTLPMPAVAYGIVAFAVFLLALGVLWSFRNTAAKIPTSGATGHGDGHGGEVDVHGGHH